MTALDLLVQAGLLAVFFRFVVLLSLLEQAMRCVVVRRGFLGLESVRRVFRCGAVAVAAVPLLSCSRNLLWVFDPCCPSA